MKFSTAIIGAGAAGMVAAISAKRAGKSVVICERMSRPGKKVLASGNGRCNLLNEDLDESHYNPASRDLVKSIFSKFGKDDIKKFFNTLGLELYHEGNRVFPATNQAASVLKTLELELKRLDIPLELEFHAGDIKETKGGFAVHSKSGKMIECQNLIIAGGGRSYPSFGSDGSAYLLAEEFGHTIITPVPAAVPILAKDNLCHILQGQRISANVTALIREKAASSASGDLLFTKYGLSGTSILDVSDEISIAINRNGEKGVVVSLDLVPFMEGKALEETLNKRLAGGFDRESLLTGILPEKFNKALKDIILKNDGTSIARALKDMRFNIAGTRGWNEADFTAGGVDTKEVNELTLESKLKKGVYFAGEVLDVNGKRGGYNLAWAWASGFVAGGTDA